MGPHGWSSDFDLDGEARGHRVPGSSRPRPYGVSPPVGDAKPPARPLQHSPAVRVVAIVALIAMALLRMGDVGSGPGATARPAASSQPLGTPQAVADTGSYRFLAMQADGAGPVAYDPCRPVPYVINLGTAPPGGELLVDEAVTIVQQVTGLKFVREGLTDEVVTAEREAFLPDRYGDRWAPILIGWTDPARVSALGGDVVGVGGSTAATFGDQTAYVSGMVALDGPQLGDAVAQGATNQVRAVIVHELAHVLGLDHVEDPTQLMYDRGTANNLGAGDLAGLARLGAGACIPRM